MKYLVPAARISVDDCERMAAAFATHRCTTREAGQLYTAWREGSRQVRERILASPELLAQELKAHFLKTQRQPQAAAVTDASALVRDLETLAAIAQRANRRAGVALAEIALSTLAPKEKEEKHVEQSATNGDSGTEGKESEQPRDRADVEGLSPKRTQSAALELHKRAGDSQGGESRTNALSTLAPAVLFYSHMLFFQINPTFQRFDCKVLAQELKAHFLTDALRYVGGAPQRVMIDTTHVVVLRGTGSEMSPVPEMEAFADRFGFRFVAHAIGDANRSARVERPFHFIENNFLAGRAFSSWEDVNELARKCAFNSCAGGATKSTRLTRNTFTQFRASCSPSSACI